MAAPSGWRMLVSGKVGGSCGSLLRAIRRGAIRTPIRAQNGRTLHTKSCLQQKDDRQLKHSFYIGGAEAQNPMKKVGIAWAIGFPSGILLFFYAKSKVQDRRVEQMKALQRMNDANKGDYKSERYRKSV